MTTTGTTTPRTTTATTTIGVLYPGFSAQDDFHRLARLLGPGVSLPVQHTEMVEDAHRADALLDWGRDDRLAVGAAALASWSPDAVVWTCTSGSFVYGWDGAHRQADALARAAGVPASSTSLAFVRAARAIGVRRVAVVATYPDAVTRLFVDFLGHAGMQVLGTASNGIYTAAEVGTLSSAAVLEMAAAGDHPDAEALLLPDTALHTAEHLDALEAHVGKPVLTANQVSVWEGLRLVERHHPRAGLGTLFHGAADQKDRAGESTETTR
ncbi:MAG: maleate cis-trans isomerase family protein [Nocardioidaceae bacterium]